MYKQFPYLRDDRWERLLNYATPVLTVLLVIVMASAVVYLAYNEVKTAKVTGPEVTRYQAGYEVGKAGFPPDCCPYSGDNYGAMLRKEWMAGWMEGARERAEMGKGVKD